MIPTTLLFTWHELGANIATMISAVAIVFVIVEYLANKNIRNIQLMQHFVRVRGTGDVILNSYGEQTDLHERQIWNEKKYFFARIDHFCKTGLGSAFVVPAYADKNHSLKKRKLAEVLYKHLRNYKY
jgi:hypothetical protein